MAHSYMFLKPRRLPLDPRALPMDIDVPLPREEAIAALEACCPGLTWRSDTDACAELDEGWAEFHLQDSPEHGQWLAMRCSLRADHGGFVQRVCDRFGWITFNEHPRLFQPGRPPEPV